MDCPCLKRKNKNNINNTINTFFSNQGLTDASNSFKIEIQKYEDKNKPINNTEIKNTNNKIYQNKNDIHS